MDDDREEAEGWMMMVLLLCVCAWSTQHGYLWESSVEEMHVANEVFWVMTALMSPESGMYVIIITSRWILLLLFPSLSSSSTYIHTYIQA